MRIIASKTSPNICSSHFLHFSVSRFAYNTSNTLIPARACPSPPSQHTAPISPAHTDMSRQTKGGKSSSSTSIPLGLEQRRTVGTERNGTLQRNATHGEHPSELFPRTAARLHFYLRQAGSVCVTVVRIIPRRTNLNQKQFRHERGVVEGVLVG